MLAWGIAAAIPVLIHFWSRRQRYETDWAAMQFLLAALQKHASRIRIEQWLLLAIRVAVLLILALALADPFLAVTAIPPATANVGRTHTVLVLDGSFSMASRTAWPVGRVTREE